MKKTYQIKKFNKNTNDPLFLKEIDKRNQIENKLNKRFSDYEWSEYRRRFVR